jgi:hypothetical protein
LAIAFVADSRSNLQNDERTFRGKWGKNGGLAFYRRSSIHCFRVLWIKRRPCRAIEGKRREAMPYSLAFSAIQQIGRAPRLLVAFIAIVVAMFYGIVSGVDEKHHRQDQALGAWLTDCAASNRRIDDCTFAWNRDYVLRNVYLGKVSATPATY